jgi:hypothetical protein
MRNTIRKTDPNLFKTAHSRFFNDIKQKGIFTMDISAKKEPAVKPASKGGQNVL